MNSGSVVSDNGPSVLPSNSMAGTQQGQYTMPGGFNPGVSFNSASVPMFGTNQPSAAPPLMPSDTMPQGSVVGQKYMTPPVSGQMLFPNQASRPGDSTPQRITPQPYGAYPSALPGSYGLPVQAPNGLSSTLLPPGNLPGNGFNRSSSAPTNVFQTNGPQSAPSGMPFGPRPPSSGPGVQQSPYTVTSPHQPNLTSRPPMSDGQPSGLGSGSPLYPGPPRMSMPYRGTLPSCPSPTSAPPMSVAPAGMLPMAPRSSSPYRGPAPPMMPPGMMPVQGQQRMTSMMAAPARGFAPPPPMMPSMLTQGAPRMGPPPFGGMAGQGAPPLGPPPMGSHMGTPVRGPPPALGAHTDGTTHGMSSLGNSVSDSASESPSQQSSRTGSPTNQMNYDDMEGQFPSPPFPGGTMGGSTAYTSPMSPAKRPIMPPTNFPGPPPPSGPAPPGQPFLPSPPGQPGLQSSNYTGSLNASMNRLHLQPDHNMPVNLLQERHILPSTRIELAEPNLPGDLKNANCSSDVMAATINAIPNTQSLLNKSRLPLGILIHPFKDLSQLPVIQSTIIVRCRSCRTYINPFVSFVDMRRWKCNLCFRVNELPEDFSYDPVSKSYGEPQRRPEIRSATIEFVAPSEYMLRPPQPAIYMYLLDVSFNAIETGYLQVFCQTLMEELERIPGDSRLQIGFITYDSSLHFYNLAEERSQPHMYIVSDLEDVELPSPDSLLVNLQESKSLVIDLLSKLPQWFEKNMETGSALGPALQAAYKMMSPTGGRVTVVQTHLPTLGPGALKAREDPNERAGKNVQNLGPVTDFYKKLALDCSAQQIAVDIFMLNSQYADIATIAGAAKYSGGCLYFFPGFHTSKNPAETERFESSLRRYFTRKIGFEAVMRIRCTRGISIHTFHGNFFVRSTDLLSLPNINPDAGYGVQMSIDETLESNYVCFQAALLYTSSRAERRIRVHTLCLPVTSQLSDVQNSANQMVIVGLLAKMAVDKSLSACLSDAREAMINAVVDMLSAFGSTLSAGQRLGQLPCLYQMRLVPLFVLAMLKSNAFRVGTSTKLDDRVFAMEQCKNLPLRYLIQMFHPDLYPVHSLDEKNAIYKDDKVIVQPPLLPLSSAHIDRHGAYLMDTGSHMYLWLGAAISDQFCHDVLGVPSFQAVTDGKTDISELDNPTSQGLIQFVQYLNEQKPFAAPLIVMREDSRSRSVFLQYLIEDRTESTLSYVEFLQHIQKEIKS